MVLTDIEMPDMNGFEFAETIRADQNLHAMPIIGLSSLVSPAYAATQYALLSSLYALPGKLVGGLSGFMVERWGEKPVMVLSFVAGAGGGYVAGGQTTTRIVTTSPASASSSMSR